LSYYNEFYYSRNVSGRFKVTQQSGERPRWHASSGQAGINPRPDRALDAWPNRPWQAADWQRTEQVLRTLPLDVFAIPPMRNT
jgi:hypothetical protein